MSILSLIAVSILGITFGSFINAYVWRVYKQSKSKSRQAKAKYSILTGRSLCPECHHILGVLDLIPVLSWLLLQGKCRYCHKPISLAYPLVELITTALFILSYIYWPLTFNSQGIFCFVVWLALLVSVIALAMYDIKWLTLPNRMLYPVLCLIVLQVVITLIFYGGGLHYLVGDLLGLLIGGGIFFVLFQLSRGKWIGGGDVKLGALLGLYLGSATDAILMIFFASVIGSMYSVPMIGSGKTTRKTLIPYGPFLITAAIILRLFGSSINTWLNTKGLRV